MAPLLPSKNILIVTLKALLSNVAVTSVAVAVELTLLNFDFPEIWSSYLKTPYVYLLINIIILTITATSHLHLHEDQSPASFLQVPSEDSFGIFDSVCVPGVFEDSQSLIVGVEMPQVIINRSPVPETTLVSPENEKPVVNSQRKRIKTSSDGAGALKVVAESRQLRRSETKENHHVYGPAAGSKKKKVVRKSATLKDRTNENHRPPSPDSGGKPSNDELNRRIEEFIKKFNNEMRLQCRDKSR